MDLKSLNLRNGKWVVANCGKFPSEKNCQLVIMAPVSQQADLVDAAAAHAEKNHGHQNNPALRRDLEKLFEVVEV